MTKGSTAAVVSAEVELVKPALAEEWLGKNQINRNVRDRVVAAYARDMAAGNWRLSGEGIKFAASGRLLDGQHRLQAVVRSQAEVWMLVVRGLADDTQQVMDSGAARTAGDALRLLGESGYSSLAAAARFALHVEAGKVNSHQDKVTHLEIIGFIERNTDLKYAVDLAASWRSSVDVPLSVLTVAIWQLYRISPEECLSFFTRLSNKNDLHPGSPILALLNRLIEVRRNNRRLDRADYLSLIFRAWNVQRAAKSISSLPVATRGGSVDIPQPK
jgi:hypothetical protein